MNIGEANAITTILAHLVQSAAVDDYPEEVVLAVVGLNARARKTLGAGLILPTVWMMRREEIDAARQARQRPSLTSLTKP